MFWLQGAISFGVWIAYGVIQSRRSHLIRSRIVQLTRNCRVAGAAALMVGSLLLLMLSLLLVNSWGGFGEHGMAAWAWVTVTVLGLGFVHAQTMAMAMLVTLAQESVTQTRAETSTRENSTKTGPL